MKLGSRNLTNDFSNIAADGPHIIDSEDSDIKGVHLVVILLNYRQTLLVCIERTVNVGILELDRLNVGSFCLGCVNVGDFVVTVLVVEEFDA